MNSRPFARLLLDGFKPTAPRQRRRIRFRLKSLLVLMTVLAVFSAVPFWWSQRVERPYRTWEHFATQLGSAEIENARAMVVDTWATRGTEIAEVPPLNDQVRQSTALQFDNGDRRRYLFFNPRLHPPAGTADHPEPTCVCILELPENVVRLFSPQRRDTRALGQKWRGELLVMETSRFVAVAHDENKEREIQDPLTFSH